MPDLDRGVSLHEWFWGRDLSLEHVQTAYGSSDFDVIARAGFRSVRIPVQPEYIFNVERPELIDRDRLAALEHAVDEALTREITVTIDMHPSLDPGTTPSSKAFDDRLRDDLDFRQRVAGSWSTLAAELSRDRDPDSLVFEAMNEPEYNDPATWSAVMGDLVDGIRRGAPDAWVIVDACHGGTLECLLRSGPLPQSQLIYAVHYYEPMAFTSQGANWITPAFEGLHAVPYPGDTDAVEAAASQLKNGARQLARTVEGWNRARIEHDIAELARWSARRDVPVTINEFGVLKCSAPRADALRWIRDVRELAESYEIRWQRWDYSAGFGIFKDECGDTPSTRTRVDQGILRVLGLH